MWRREARKAERLVYHASSELYSYLDISPEISFVQLTSPMSRARNKPEAPSTLAVESVS